MMEMVVALTVHAAIPLMLLAYSLIYSLFDKNASILREIFLFRGMLYPTIYLLFYLLVAFIWADPYNVTDLQHNIG
jgi:hypothetical protein